MTDAVTAARVSGIGFEPAAVLFDMDGLMIESERALLDCWRAATHELSLGLDDGLWVSMVGVHERACVEMLRECLPEASVQALLARTDELYGERVDLGLPLKPGLLELLDLLAGHGLPKAVVTSTRRERAEHKLSRCGLRPHFETVVTGSDVTHPKPSPEIYLLAAHTLGVDPHRCVVLEDSVPGVRAALAAGMTPIQVPDLAIPDGEAHALGHRIVSSLVHARALIEPVLTRTDGPRADR